MKPLNGQKVIFLDRDGIINKKANEHDYIKSWDQFVFIEGIAEAIKTFNENGFKVVVVTNQRGIALGMMNAEDVELIHNKMITDLEKKKAMIYRVIYCPHENAQCQCRKPEIGMFLKAEEEFLIDRENSFMIGDSDSDMQAGRKYGVKSIFVGNGQSESADFRCKNLREVVDLIIRG